MSHEVETMAYAGETPWHGLGVPVNNDLTPVQMMQKAGLDWTVDKVDAFVRVGNQEIRTGQQALVRSSDNKILTNVGENWNPVQNEDAFNFFSEFVMSGDMDMHTAGSLRGGQMVWALAKTNESFDVFGDDKVDSYLLFSNPHQYGKSIDVRFTPIRVVCNNTLSMSLGMEADKSVRVGHRVEFDADAVKETLGLAHEKFQQYKEMAEFLGSKRYDMESLIQYYNDVFPSTARNVEEPKPVTADTLSRAGKQALSVIDTQPGAQYAEGSWWQALNSVTYITDHVQGRGEDTRLYSNWFGGNQLRKVRAAEKAVEYATAA
tara:strand:+ start:2746 stop:3702 length:957 start_codon:yes stop_codon:yes gene_type:complete